MDPDVEAIAAQPCLVLFLGDILEEGAGSIDPGIGEVPGAHLAIVGNDEEGLVPHLEEMLSDPGEGPRLIFFPDRWRRGQAAFVC
jgi:hypothetical protein